MPISHFTKVFAAKDAKLFPLTADPAGGSPTYGTGIDVPGLKSVTITGDVTNVQLRGDNTLLDSASTLSGIAATMEFAKLSLDLLAAFFASLAVTDSGTTPNQKSVVTVLGTTPLAYFGMTFQAVGADVITGDVQYALYKCILSSFPELGLAEEDYKTSNVEMQAMPLLANSKWIGTTLNETTAALAAPA